MRLALIVLLLLLPAALCAAESGKATVAQLRAGFAHPGNAERALPMVAGGEYRDPAAFAAKLAAGGWGGVHLSYPHGGPGYLRDEAGWAQFEAAVQACKAQGLNVWIYDESGYPSGRAGGHVLEGHPEYEAQGLFYDSRDVAVGKQPEEVEWRLPEGTPFYVALCRLDWYGRITGTPEERTPQVNDGVLRLQLQPGHWRLIAFVQNRLREGTHASLTGGPYINILDPEAVRRFIAVTHEAYYAHCGAEFGKTIQAFFNDEASLMNGYLADGTPPSPAIGWYHGLPELFRQRAGYDIRECLPALFNNVGPETARKRCDFYRVIAQQIADAFFKPIREWCAAHHVASTGHLLWEESLLYHVPFYGSYFPALRELDWPGIDVLGCSYAHTSGSHTDGGPVVPKLIGSAAHLYGKPRTMTESFCFVTGKTPVEDLLAHLNWQWVLGINSLTTLSIHTQYPAESFRRLNDYTGRLSTLLTQGRFTADVAILYPIASVWADFQPTPHHVSYFDDNPRARDVDEAWRAVSAATLACQRDFDYLDEEAIQGAMVSNGKLAMGENRYSVLILPHVTTLDYRTLQQIQRFVVAGGTVISYETLPYTRADAGPAQEQRALVDALWGREKGVVHTASLPAFCRALLRNGTPDLLISPATPDVYYQHRVLTDGDLYFLVNNSLQPVAGDFTFRAAGRCELWNPLTGEVTPARAARKGSASVLKLTLPPRSGRFVIFSR